MRTLKDALLSNGFRPNTQQEDWDRFNAVAAECVANRKPCGRTCPGDHACNACTHLTNVVFCVGA